MNHDFLAQPPKEIAEALGWKISPTTSAEEAEEVRAMQFFEKSTTISNPWTVQPSVGGVIQYGGDDEALAEQEYAAGVEPIKKLFAKDTDAAKTQQRYSAPPVIKQDDDEKDYYAALAPLQKLFSGDGITTIAQPKDENRFQFSKRATPEPEKPLAKSQTGNDELNLELEASLQTALDEAINFCLPSSEDESTFDFFRRVDQRLQALGYPTVLTAPTWTTY